MDNDLFSLFNSLDDTPLIREHYVRVPIGYPGSKDRSLDKLLEIVPYGNTYAEHFGGSGALLLARKPSNLEVFNDRYAGVVCFYRCLKDKSKLERLCELIELSIHSREEFVWCKETWNTQDVKDDVDRAYRWLYMHQNSFGKKENAFGRAIKGKAQAGKAFRNLPPTFYPVHCRLANVQIENLDWRQSLTDYDNHDTVHYLDPTYLGVTRGVYKHELSVADHVELCHRVMKLEGWAGVSGYDNPETRDVYYRFDWDDIQTWEVHQSMTGLAFSDTNNLAAHENHIERGAAKEILFIKDFK